MKLTLTILFVFLTSLAFSNTGRYRLTLRDNPATSIVVGWDQVSGSNPVVYYGTVDQGTNWSAYQSSETPNRTVDYKGMNNHFARITGLSPDTFYYFVIRDSQGTSSRYYFKTAPNDPNKRLSFIAGGDSRNNRTPRQNANRLVAKLRPTAVLFGGDMTDNGSTSQWINWFNDWQLTISSDGRMYPIVATRGNHESSNGMVVDLFDVPSSNVYYALNFGGNLVRSYTLNTEISISGNQTSWLANDLAANSNAKWKIAQYHKPMRPHVSSKREGNSQYSSWANLFYNNDVKLVVECDAHTVKTTWPVRPSNGSGSDEGFIRDNQNGTVYTGEGCWGAPLRSNNDGKNWTRNSGRFNQFKWIFVDQSKIEVRTIGVDNATSVGSVSNNNPFQIPTNLDVWNPSNGSVVTINAGSTPPLPTNCDNTFPEVEGFEGNLDFDNVGGDDINWAVRSGSTPSRSTGPSGASVGSNYMYIESSNPNFPSKVALLESECYDFSRLNHPVLSFDYHMYGGSMGTLQAQIKVGNSSFSTVWTKSGNQGNQWLTATVSLSNYANLDDIIFRFRGTTGSSWQSDICIDNIRINESAGDPDNPDPVSQTFSKRISSSNDDVEEEDDGSMYRNSSDLELVSDGSRGNQTIGLRFTGVNIPSGATINSAYIQFNVDETRNENGSIRIYGHDTNNASTFGSSNNNVSNRTRTSASVDWNPSSWNSVGAEGAAQRTVDLSSIVSEITSRSGWSSGNSMAFVITGSGKRVAESYDGSTSRAPQLVVNYSTSTSNGRSINDHTLSDNVDLGQEELYEGNDEISLYPNPSDKEVFLSYGSNWIGAKITVFNLNGAVIVSSILKDTKMFVVDQESLAEGMYLVNVEKGKLQFSTKLIKR